MRIMKILEAFFTVLVAIQMESKSLKETQIVVIGLSFVSLRSEINHCLVHQTDSGKTAYLQSRGKILNKTENNAE